MQSLKQYWIFGILIGILLIGGCDEGGDNDDDNDNNTAQLPTWETCQEWIAHSAAYPATVPSSRCPDESEKGRNEIIEAGGGIFPAGDNMYYLVRFPASRDQFDGMSVVFTLHGPAGCAEDVFEDWYTMTQQMSVPRDYAIVSLQYWDPERPFQLDAYDDDQSVYANLVSITTEIAEHCPVAELPKFLYGFSRGSTLTFSIAVDDRAAEGLHLFSAFVADSGAWSAEGPLPDTLQEVVQNDRYNAFDDARFWLYCGQNDMTETGVDNATMCEVMDNARDFVVSYGGNIDRFFVAEQGAHGMFSDRTPQTPGKALEELFNYIDSFL